MLGKKALFPVVLLVLFLRCADEQLLISEPSALTTENLNTVTDGTAVLDDCAACTYVVPADVRIVDGELLGLKPGSVIGLSANVSYGNLLFRNIVGTLENPITIRNCGGTARINGTGTGHGIKTENSAYFRITGGDIKNSYGIIVTGGQMSINLGKLSTHFEVDHLEIQNSGFAGIMAKTDPTCDDATLRENFVMKGVALHNNYIHDTGGEGIYAGNSFFMGMNTNCGVRLPHEIHYIRIFGNIVKNTGWDGIQLGCATKGASIHNNVIENYGTINKTYQNNGIQIGAGTGGVCYNNLIKNGTGNGLIVNGLGDNIIYNNVIDHPGTNGVFCDERYSPGPGFKFINNTIISPKWVGIKIYAEEVPMNVIVNNIITNPGYYSVFTNPETAFVQKLNSQVNIDMRNNYFNIDTTTVNLSNAIDSSYRLASTSPVVDMGADISVYNIRFDYHYKPRLKGSGYDIGAVEQ